MNRISASITALGSYLPKKTLTNKELENLVDTTDEWITTRTGIKESKVLMNIEKYGNTTAATIPLILSDYEKKFKKGDNIIFAAFGGGFTWGASFLKWGYNS